MNEATTNVVDRNAAADRISSILAPTKPVSEDTGRSEDEIVQDTLADLTGSLAHQPVSG